MLILLVGACVGAVVLSLTTLKYEQYDFVELKDGDEVGFLDRSKLETVVGSQVGKVDGVAKGDDDGELAGTVDGAILGVVDGAILGNFDESEPK